MTSTRKHPHKHQELLDRLRNEVDFHEEQCTRHKNSIREKSNDILKHRDSQDKIRRAIEVLEADDNP